MIKLINILSEIKLVSKITPEMVQKEFDKIPEGISNVLGNQAEIDYDNMRDNLNYKYFPNKKYIGWELIYMLPQKGLQEYYMLIFNFNKKYNL